MDSASWKSLAVPVTEKDTVYEVKRKYSQQAGISPDRIHITFREQAIQDENPLDAYGITPGELHLAPLDQEATRSSWRNDLEPSLYLLALTSPLNPETIVIKSSPESMRPDLTFNTIRLSCQSHTYSAGQGMYGGFIMYGWTNENRDIVDYWTLNGKRCRSAYVLIQCTDSDDIKRYTGRSEDPEQVASAVYRNFFGREADPGRAVGEGFCLQNGVYTWNSVVFNRSSDDYGDGLKEVSGVVRKCVKRVVDDWMVTSPTGKTYSVKTLLSDENMHQFELPE